MIYLHSGALTTTSLSAALAGLYGNLILRGPGIFKVDLALPNMTLSGNLYPFFDYSFLVLVNIKATSVWKTLIRCSTISCYYS